MKSWRSFVEQILFIIIAGVMLGGIIDLGFYFINKSTTKPKLHTAMFEQTQCFDDNGIQEPWHVSPQGIVVLKGFTKYLVMFAPEAEATGRGVKIGVEVDIVSFDAEHHQVLCPPAWRLHTHKDLFEDKLR
jgi:hypothetical protein